MNEREAIRKRVWEALRRVARFVAETGEGEAPEDKSPEGADHGDPREWKP